MPASKVVFENAGPDGPSLSDVADLIKEGKAKNIIVLVGAGISTAAGIPDFRSPGTGLYDNLAQYNLPYPEAIFDITYFQNRPEAFFTLAKELFPGNFAPTLTHYFLTLLHEKGLLKRLFTQNVDTLERIAGLPDDKIVEAHGSFASAHCLNCRQEFGAEDLRPQIARGEVIRCKKTMCKKSGRGLIKSDIVFFGEALPSLFFKRLSDFRSCDLLITIGTSLKVHPFASLIDRVNDNVPRLLINLEKVGEMDDFEESLNDGMYGGKYREEGFDFNGISRGGKKYSRDVAWLGHADDGVREIAKKLGWLKELELLHEEGKKEHKSREHLRTGSLPPTPAKGVDGQTKTKKVEQEELTSSNSSSEEEGDRSIDDSSIVEPPTAADQKAENTAAAIGEAVEKTPQDNQRTEAVDAKEEEVFNELAKEIEKLDVGSDQSAKGVSASSAGPGKVETEVREESSDESKKKSDEEGSKKSAL